MIYNAYHLRLSNQNQMLTEPIDLLHKPHNARVPYTKMHQFISEMCTMLLQNRASWIISQMQWNLSGRSINS